ncbi:MAG: hypothetical protein P1U69_00355 [Parvibaculaceae bacterium]|nr:hypothetical protein [Parvibaculaceae bacterium]HBM89891.1 hypothetical protein [Rhodobiaceae bacterium]|tara:strand:- start:9372 stop:9968 length:597 start_codon:yes stop_codon:yes gene_type:complete
MFQALWIHTLPLRALLAAALIGVSAAALTFPYDGVDMQRSSRDVVREILDDWDKRAAEMDLMRNRTGVSLLFSTLSGNIEALVSGTSLPKHPEQGFFVSLPPGDYRGVIWKSQPIASVDSREYLLEFQVEPIHGATLGIQVIDEVGSVSWSADIASDGILNTTRFSASGERLRIELTAKTETGGLSARVLHLNMFGVL